MFEFFWSNPVSCFLIMLGIVLILAGLVWPMLPKFAIGRLPGDIVVESDGSRLYLAIVTSVLVSLALTLLLWLLSR